jgi:hypothetical protein
MQRRDPRCRRHCSRCKRAADGRPRRRRAPAARPAVDCWFPPIRAMSPWRIRWPPLSGRDSELVRSLVPALLAEQNTAEPRAELLLFVLLQESRSSGLLARVSGRPLYATHNSFVGVDLHLIVDVTLAITRKLKSRRPSPDECVPRVAITRMTEAGRSLLASWPAGSGRCHRESDSAAGCRRPQAA